MELNASKIDGKQFILGQLELSLIIKRAIGYYKFHNKNELPKAVVIPYLEEVDGIKIVYDLPVKAKVKHEED